MQVKHLHEFGSTAEVREYFSSEDIAINYWINYRWSEGVRCVKCNSDNIQTNDNRKFRCRDCRKQFSYLVGSIFQNTKLPLMEWFPAIHEFMSSEKSISSYNMADKIKVMQPTAWLMLQRIRNGFRFVNFDFMHPETTIEQPEQIEQTEQNEATQLDEAGIHGLQGNKSCHNKEAYSQGRGIRNRKAIGMVKKLLQLFHIPNANAKTITKLVYRHIAKGSLLNADDWGGYNDLDIDYIVKRVNHSAKQFCNGKAHTNKIERIWRTVKSLIFGTHHKVADKYFQAYLHEMVVRYNLRKVSIFARFQAVLKLACTGYKTRRELSLQLAA
jgi:transposase-like protein